MEPLSLSRVIVSDGFPARSTVSIEQVDFLHGQQTWPAWLRLSSNRSSSPRPQPLISNTPSGPESNAPVPLRHWICSSNPDWVSVGHWLLSYLGAVSEYISSPSYIFPNSSSIKASMSTGASLPRKVSCCFSLRHGVKSISEILRGLSLRPDAQAAILIHLQNTTTVAVRQNARSTNSRSPI